MNFENINFVLWGEQTYIPPTTIQMSVKFWHPYIVSFQTLASLPNFSRSFQRHGWIFQQVHVKVQNLEEGSIQLIKHTDVAEEHGP